MSIERALLADVAGLFDRLDPVPASSVADAELAYSELGSDVDCRRWVSLPAEENPFGMRGVAPARALRFGDRFGSLRIELARPTATSVGVTGMLRVSWPEPSLAVRTPDRSVCVCLDEFGVFGAVAVPQGPLSIQVFRAGRPAASTPWFAA